MIVHNNIIIQNNPIGNLIKWIVDVTNSEKQKPFKIHNLFITFNIGVF